MNQIKLKRIGSEINQILCEICLEEAHDSLLHSITITGVEVTSDLGLARVYFTSPLDKEHKQLEKELNDSTAGFLRSKLADKIEIRHIPKIRFQYDNSIAYGNNIEDILNKINDKDGE